VQTFAENNRNPGGDPAALKMVLDGELGFFALNGGSIGNVVPPANIQKAQGAWRRP
jgi:hypothetical protein